MQLYQLLFASFKNATDVVCYLNRFHCGDRFHLLRFLCLLETVKRNAAPALPTSSFPLFSDSSWHGFECESCEGGFCWRWSLVVREFLRYVVILWLSVDVSRKWWMKAKKTKIIGQMRFECSTLSICSAKDASMSRLRPSQNSKQVSRDWDVFLFNCNKRLAAMEG